MTDGVSLLSGGENGGAVADRRASFALPGLLLAGGALVAATISLFILLGLTPIKPEPNVVIASASINAIFIVGLMFLIGREIARLLRARSRGRAAAMSLSSDSPSAISSASTRRPERSPVKGTPVRSAPR